MDTAVDRLENAIIKVLMVVVCALMIANFTLTESNRSDLKRLGKETFRSWWFWAMYFTFVTGMCFICVQNQNASTERLVFGVVLACLALGLEALRIRDQFRRVAGHSPGVNVRIFLALLAFNNVMAASFLAISFDRVLRRWLH